MSDLMSKRCELALTAALQAAPHVDASAARLALRQRLSGREVDVEELRRVARAVVRECGGGSASEVRP